MTAHRLLTVTAAAGVLVLGTPSHAQPVDGPLVLPGDPVAAPLPPPPPLPPIPAAQAAEAEWDDDAGYYPAPPPLPPMVHPMPHGGYPMAPQMAYHPGPHHPGYGPHFDRDAWLRDCRERIRGVSRKDRAGVIGGLLGAAVGGVVGNRAWDSERLAGTLLGAGVGGLAGVAIGAAIGAAGDRRREDECAAHLDGYLARGYPGYGYGYGYGQVAYVPVMVQVPQRAVIREYVTEEVIDEPVRASPPVYRPAPRPETKILPRPAPRSDKRIKLIKGS